MRLHILQRKQGFAVAGQNRHGAPGASCRWAGTTWLKLCGSFVAVSAVDGPLIPTRDRRDAISIFCLWLLFVFLPTGTLLQVHCLGLWKPIAPIIPPLSLVEAKPFSQRAYENALSESASTCTPSYREAQKTSRSPIDEQGTYERLPDFSSACCMPWVLCTSCLQLGARLAGVRLPCMHVDLSFPLVMAWVGSWTTNLRAIDSDTKKTHLCQAQGSRLLRSLVPTMRLQAGQHSLRSTSAGAG